MTIFPDFTKYPKVSRLDIYNTKFYMKNNVISKLYKTQRLPNNTKITGHIDPLEGYFMYDLIRKNNFQNCLEVGMANGMSALYICQALKENGGGTLFSIDPFQTSQWKGMAVENLKEANLSKYSILIEEKDTEALPKLLSFCEKESKRVKKSMEILDFVFIDGDHRFDYTLLDFFYTALMLKIGGVIVVDDIKMSGVRDVIDYLTKNYIHFRRVKSPSPTIAVFTKISEDKRMWNFHRDF